MSKNSFFKCVVKTDLAENNINVYREIQVTLCNILFRLEKSAKGSGNRIKDATMVLRNFPSYNRSQTMI